MAIRTTLNSNLQQIWHCKKLNATTWDKPKKYMINIAQDNSTQVIQVGGVDIPQTLVCVCSQGMASNFSVGDRFYYNKKPPQNHITSQNTKASANFEMAELPTNSINSSRIVLRYLKGR